MKHVCTVFALCRTAADKITSAAFEIADDLLRSSDFQSHGVVPLREHIDFLMLLAHSRADMLCHSSRAIAAAALLTSLRIQAGPAAAAAAAAQLPPAAAADGASACAAAMWALREGAAPPPPAAWSDVAKSAPAAIDSESKAGSGRASEGAAGRVPLVPLTGDVPLASFAPPPVPLVRVTD